MKKTNKNLKNRPPSCKKFRNPSLASFCNDGYFWFEYLNHSKSKLTLIEQITNIIHNLKTIKTTKVWESIARSFPKRSRRDNLVIFIKTGSGVQRRKITFQARFLYGTRKRGAMRMLSPPLVRYLEYSLAWALICDSLFTVDLQLGLIRVKYAFASSGRQ